MMQRAKILVTQNIPAEAYALLETVGEVDGNHDSAVTWWAEELLVRARGYDYMLCMVTNTIDEQLLLACTEQEPRLKLVANMAVGYNNIDVAAATRLSVIVTNTPGTLGLIGAGRIGQIMAKRASGFAMKVLYYNRHRLTQEEEARYGLNYMPLQELLQQSDFISIHVPYSKETHHLISSDELKQMKNTAILINTARGPIVDEKALVHALREGVIAGAGLDVFEQEPVIEPELLTMENVVLLPHIGSASVKTRTQMALIACKNIVAHATGKQPPNVVNPDALA